MNRTFSVLLNGVHNPKIPVIYDVPQGSILRPLPFTLYIKELNYLGDEFSLTVLSYANDTILCIGFLIWVMNLVLLFIQSSV